jgi:exosortase
LNVEFNKSLGAKILVAMLAPIILYWQDFVIIFNEALNSDLSTHIIILPILLGYLLYRIRYTFAASATELFQDTSNRSHFPFREISGALLCLLAYLTTWYGSYTFNPLEYHIASLPIFIAGLILLIFNAQTLRTLLFPIAFLLFLVPPPAELAQSVGAALAVVSSQVSYTLLKTTGFPVSLLNEYGSPVIYLTRPNGVTIPFVIDIACSGLYSLIGFILFAVFTAYISKGSLPKKLAVLSIGFPIIFLLNILRVTLIIVIGYYSGPDLALNIFHLLGGWTLILLGTLVLILTAEKVFKIQIFRRNLETCTHPLKEKEGKYCLQCGKILKNHPLYLTKKDILKLGSIVMISILLLSIQVPVFALTKGSTEVFIKKPSGEEAVAKILPEIEGYELRFSYRDEAFEKISGQNASIFYQYFPKGNSKQIIWVGLEISTTKGNLHPWEVCLITWPQTHGGQATVNQLDLRDIRLFDNPPITARYFAFHEKGSNVTQVILYWYTQSIFKTESGYQQKWSKISVIEYTINPNNYKTVEEDILPISKAIANYWQPIASWSWVALSIAQNGLTLILITLFLIAGSFSYYLYHEYNRRKTIKGLYERINYLEDRGIIDAIKALRKEIASETKIKSKYDEITKKDINLNTINDKLVLAEKSGIIRRKMISINDEPYIIWKSNI